jgi:regulator of nonsense transcripts 3
MAQPLDAPAAAAGAAIPTPAKGKNPAQLSAASGGASKRGKRVPRGQQQQQASAPAERERPTTGGGGAAPPKLKIVVRRLPANIPEEVFWSSTAQWVNDETAGWKVFRKGKVAKACVVVVSPPPLTQPAPTLWLWPSDAGCRGCYRDKEPTHSRAYILFKSQAALLDFHRSYDGHLLRDKAGASPCEGAAHASRSYRCGLRTQLLTHPQLPLRMRSHIGNESVAVVEYAVYQKVPVARPKADPKAGSIDTGASPAGCKLFAPALSTCGLLSDR